MRLAILRTGHGLRNRVALRLMRLISGTEPDDVIKTSLYRPRFFGRVWIALLRAVMRGPSDWTPGERELFAAFVSLLNACPFCVGIHSKTSALMMDPGITVDSLKDWRTAGFEPRIASIFHLLEKLTLHPETVDLDDIAQARSAGVSDRAIVDAIHVCFLFSLVNRLANALAYDYGTEDEALRAAAVLKRVNYMLPGFLLR